ncbi:hypothetical protein CC78DRAFT_582168 [Lojkania enalia]|uniref:Uncharacterized protein n=1 Tax=Lojkania enalia TaxID=147567 RepID=A0A9P4N2Q8_9PLEO|nr:hypothetical protein CC78DRAFT_582168 [Didymosphaeria enalia]
MRLTTLITLLLGITFVLSVPLKVFRETFYNSTSPVLTSGPEDDGDRIKLYAKNDCRQFEALIRYFWIDQKTVLTATVLDKGYGILQAFWLRELIGCVKGLWAEFTKRKAARSHPDL